jgi:hypothetical protein
MGGGGLRELRAVLAEVEVELALVGGCGQVVCDVDKVAIHLLAKESAVVVPKGNVKPDNTFLMRLQSRSDSSSAAKRRLKVQTCQAEELDCIRLSAPQATRARRR